MAAVTVSARRKEQHGQTPAPPPALFDNRFDLSTNHNVHCFYFYVWPQVKTMDRYFTVVKTRRGASSDDKSKSQDKFHPYPKVERTTAAKRKEHIK